MTAQKQGSVAVMSHHIKDKSRVPATFFPEVLNDFISTANPVRVVDVLIIATQKP